jgi:hypothetical protein
MVADRVSSAEVGFTATPWMAGYACQVDEGDGNPE